MLTRLTQLLAFSLLASCTSTSSPLAKNSAELNDIEHIIVIYAENRSFDNLYGLFPGANGINNSTVEQYTQVDHDGKVLAALPSVWPTKQHGAASITARLPNRPFQLDSPELNLPASVITRDLVHRYYQSIEQINNGQNNKFAAISDAGGLVMGYYDGAKLPLWQWAKEYVLADNFFMGAFGGSYLNHQWLICACTPTDPDAPANIRAQIDNNSHLLRKPNSPNSALQGPPELLDGSVTPDGFSVNTQYSPYQPSGIPPAVDGDSRFANPAEHSLPPQTAKTIGDTLSDKGVSWVWYASGWDAALNDSKQTDKKQRKVIYTNKPGTINFQAHHQPFNYYLRYAPGTTARTQHLKDGEEFLKSISDGTLPQVAFYKPAGDLNEHPGYTDVLSGDQHISNILERIRRSPVWNKSVVIVTYDENGGFWDHVAPLKGDRWGPGSRIPALIISPFAKRNFIDHSTYDTTSIIKFITRRFGLEALPGVRENVGDLLNTLNIQQ